MMIQIGYDASVEKEKVVGILSSNSSWAKRYIKKAEEEGRLINATSGRKARSIIVTVEDKVVVVFLTALKSQTFAARYNEAEVPMEEIRK